MKMEKKDHKGVEKERVHDTIDSDVGSEEDKSMGEIKKFTRERERPCIIFSCVLPIRGFISSECVCYFVNKLSGPSCVCL